MRRKVSIWNWVHIGLLTIQLFSVACHAWGYHHPAAIRLPTTKMPSTTTSTTTESTTTTTAKSIISSASPITSVRTTESEATPSTTYLGISNNATTAVNFENFSVPTTTFPPTTKEAALNTTIDEVQKPGESKSESIIAVNAATSTVPTSTSTAESTTSKEESISTTKGNVDDIIASSGKALELASTSASTSTFLSSSTTPQSSTSSSTSTSTREPEPGESPTSTSPSDLSTISASTNDSSFVTEISQDLVTNNTSTSSSTSQSVFTSSRNFSNEVAVVLKTENSSNSEKTGCSRNESIVNFWDFGYCTNNCTVDTDCNIKQNERCVCDGPCGMSCLSPDLTSIYCDAPRSVENGKALLVGELGLYDYRNQLQRFKHNQRILFECDEGFTLIDGPQEKICRIGLWFPAVGEPKCIFSDTPGFRWMQGLRVKRRAIKSGSASTRLHSRVGNARRAGAGGGRRKGGKKGETPEGEEEEVDEETSMCPDLDEEEEVMTELITPGTDPNNTMISDGAVVKVSCNHGFGLNLQNDTISCDNGRWRPKIPLCSPSPCNVPHIAHGTLYLGGKGLFFMELKNHGANLELRCSKGYGLKGPSRFHCSFGEWDLKEVPECIPASCTLPQLDRGSYASRYRSGSVVGHGTEVDYHCDGDFQKMAPGGPAKCYLGDWRPNKPACFHPSFIHGMKNMTHDKDNKLITSIRRSCGLPRKEKGAVFYVEGKPIDYDTDFVFPDATEVMYRCASMKPKIKNRWKQVCEDGQWTGGSSNFTCEMNATVAANITAIVKDTIRMINSSCLYKKKETHVVTFFNDQQLVMDSTEFPHGSVLINRCVDIGKFKLLGAVRRQCGSGQWLGITPKCEGMSQYYDYIVDKPPTILFRYLNGSIVQTNEGKLMIYPGTTVHMECLYIRRFGRPQWKVSNTEKEYPEGWTDGIENRDPSLEYRLTIEDASEEDTGTFSCITPSRYSHQVDIVVKKVDCPALPEQHDLIYSTDSTMLGTKVTFQCKDSNSLIGAQEIICQATGSWSAPLPKCENVECPDISIVPAMVPLAYTSVTRNGTLKKNETAPPKISVLSREVGGKATFTCLQGYMVEGSTEAVCQSTGEWSSAIPLCKEVECPPPPSPDNGYVTGNAPYKAGDLAQFECRQGYMMEGQPIIACQDNGKWSRASSTTKCVKACTYPGTTIGGTISAVKFYYPIGETVEFDCTEGYDLQGSRMLHCLESAKWSTSIPNCIPRDGNAGAILGR